MTPSCFSFPNKQHLEEERLRLTQPKVYDPLKTQKLLEDISYWNITFWSLVKVWNTLPGVLFVQSSAHLSNTHLTKLLVRGTGQRQEVTHSEFPVSSEVGSGLEPMSSGSTLIPSSLQCKTTPTRSRLQTQSKSCDTQSGGRSRNQQIKGSGTEKQNTNNQPVPDQRETQVSKCMARVCANLLGLTFHFSFLGKKNFLTAEFRNSWKDRSHHRYLAQSGAREINTTKCKKSKTFLISLHSKPWFP